MVYSELVERLRAAGVESPEREASLLEERYCGGSGFFADPGRELQGDGLEDAVRRRCAGEPLQYIFGEWYFYNQTYAVSPDCLIPRSDTEILVEAAISMLPKESFFADLCTGSGCIAVSVTAERPDLSCVAVDLSEGALTMAKKNAERNGVADRVKVMRANVLEPEPLFALPRPAAILSNPPYIRTDVIPTLAREVKWEPHMALDGGEDGLIFYRALLELARCWLAEEGFCLFEIGYDQGDALRAMAEEAGFLCEIRRDYGGCDRVAYLRRRSIK